MVQLVRHRQTKESATDRLNLNHRVTPRLHTSGLAAIFLDGHMITGRILKSAFQAQSQFEELSWCDTVAWTVSHSQTRYTCTHEVPLSSLLDAAATSQPSIACGKFTVSQPPPAPVRSDKRCTAETCGPCSRRKLLICKRHVCPRVQ